MLQALIAATANGYVTVSAWEKTEPPLFIETGDMFRPVWPVSTPLPPDVAHNAELQGTDGMETLYRQRWRLPMPSPSPSFIPSTQDENNTTAPFSVPETRALGGNQTKPDPFLDENLVRNLYSNVLHAFFKKTAP